MNQYCITNGQQTFCQEHILSGPHYPFGQEDVLPGPFYAIFFFKPTGLYIFSGRHLWVVNTWALLGNYSNTI